MPSELNLPFRVSHVISNGCSAPSEWQGHAADLALALQATGDALPVAALVPGSFVILPHEYSLQRVLMHSVVRGRDVLGYCRLSMSDAKLLQGATLPVVTIADDSIPVPPLVDVATPGEASPGADTPVAEQLLVLTPGSVPRVGSVSASADLPGIAAELLRGGAPLFGVDVGPGRFSLATLAAIEYADAYFFSKTGVGKGEYRGDTWLQPLGSPSGPDDGTAKTLRSLTTFSVVPASEGGDLRGFGHTFFRRREGEAKGMGSTFYHLPPTFYASQYAATHGEVATLQLTMPQVHPSLRP